MVWKLILGIGLIILGYHLSNGDVLIYSTLVGGGGGGLIGIALEEWD